MAVLVPMKRDIAAQRADVDAQRRMIAELLATTQRQLETIETSLQVQRRGVDETEDTSAKLDRLLTLTEQILRELRELNQKSPPPG